MQKLVELQSNVHVGGIWDITVENRRMSSNVYKPTTRSSYHYDTVRSDIAAYLQPRNGLYRPKNLLL